VPTVHCLCEDDAVLGTPFYVMDFLDGRIFTDVTLPEIESAEERKQLCVVTGPRCGRLIKHEPHSWFSVVRTLAKLHKLDPVAIGLKDYGSFADFYPRQIKSLSRVSAAQAEVKDKETGEPVGEIPDIKALLHWYGKNCPRGETTIVHGDFKMDNMVRLDALTHCRRSLISDRSSTRPSPRSSACSIGSSVRSYVVHRDLPRTWLIRCTGTSVLQPR
jgi:aminoglycoside phosphotransferase (APT) family kinase protein